jgi:hypothetical protein
MQLYISGCGSRAEPAREPPSSRAEPVSPAREMGEPSRAATEPHRAEPSGSARFQPYFQRRSIFYLPQSRLLSFPQLASLSARRARCSLVLGLRPVGAPWLAQARGLPAPPGHGHCAVDLPAHAPPPCRAAPSA